MATTVRPIAGIAYPFQKQGRGLPLAATGSQVYSSALRCLLQTDQRTRVMRPDLGTRLLQLIFENTGPILRNAITREIVNAAAVAIPQINIQHVDITESNTLVTVNVFFSVQGIQDQTGTIEFGRAA